MSRSPRCFRPRCCCGRAFSATRCRCRQPAPISAWRPIARCSPFGFRQALDFVSVLSIGIPAVIAGLGVMLFYLSLPIGVYGTVWILVVAYSYRFATTTRLARAGFLQIHRELEEASAASGARWLATQRRVLLPLLRPALTAGFVLLFIVGVREFTIPLVLSSPDNVVLSVLLWQLFQSGQPGPSAALACLVIV